MGYGTFFGNGGDGDENNNGNGQIEMMDDGDGMVDGNGIQPMEIVEESDNADVADMSKAENIEDELRVIYGADKVQSKLGELLQVIVNFKPNNGGELETFFADCDKFFANHGVNLETSEVVDFHEVADFHFLQLSGRISKANADTLLHYALRAGNLDAAEYLQKQGLDLYARGNNNQTAEELLTHAKNKITLDGLRAASNLEDELRIIYGADQVQNKMNQILRAVENFNPVQDSELKAFFDDYEQFLESHKANLNDGKFSRLGGRISKANADTLLHHAIRIGNIGAAEYLQKQGLDLYARGNNNQTAEELLTHAKNKITLDGLRAASNLEDELRVIYGADQVQNKMNQILRAVENFNPVQDSELEAFFDDYEQFLESHKAKLNDGKFSRLGGRISKANADTLLHHAIRIGNIGAAEYLKEQGLDSDAKGNNNQTTEELLADLRAENMLLDRLRGSNTLEDEFRVIYGVDQAQAKVTQILRAVKYFIPDKDSDLEIFFDDYDNFLLEHIKHKVNLSGFPRLNSRISKASADTLLQHALRIGNLGAVDYLLKKDTNVTKRLLDHHNFMFSKDLRKEGINELLDPMNAMISEDQFYEDGQEEIGQIIASL